MTLVIKEWSLKQHQNYLRVFFKGGVSGSIPKLFNQNWHFNKIPKIWKVTQSHCLASFYRCTS